MNSAALWFKIILCIKRTPFLPCNEAELSQLSSLCVFDMIKSLLLKEKESRHFLFVVVFFFIFFLVCALHSGGAIFQFMRMTNILSCVCIRGGLTRFTQELLMVCRRKHGGDACPSPPAPTRRRPLPAPAGATRVAETGLLCNFASVLS